MILSQKAFADSLAGCWTGKNIGGVFGAPFEVQRKVQTAQFYVQDLSQGPPPNDDLDLQIVWLAAVEKYGRQVSASILGEYWLSFVIPNWVEYGTGKANLRAGLVPPLSGITDNVYALSNGCWIRSEIWACLAPGHPEIATRYAYEDGIVDHAGEGVYGEIFFAAVESAAFIEKNLQRLIAIGLSYIPENCKVAEAILLAQRCYEEHVPFLEMRKRVHSCVPGSFGIQNQRLSDIPIEGNEGMEPGVPGMDAPENVAFTVASLFYGEGDFEKSMILCNSCGEDTDCTCGTLGAIFGIRDGVMGLPAKWRDPLDDRIATMCINRTWGGIWIPETSTQLADRILRDVPAFLGQELCDIFGKDGMEIVCLEGDALFCDEGDDRIPFLNIGACGPDLRPVKQFLQNPFVVRYNFPAFIVFADYGENCTFFPGEERRFSVRVYNNMEMRQQQWVKIRLYLPEGVRALGGSCVELPLNNLNGSFAEKEFTVLTEGFTEGRLEVMIDISLVGRHSDGPVKMVFTAK